MLICSAIAGAPEGVVNWWMSVMERGGFVRGGFGVVGRS